MANKVHGRGKIQARMEAGTKQGRDPGDPNLSWPGGLKEGFSGARVLS